MAFTYNTNNYEYEQTYYETYTQEQLLKEYQQYQKENKNKMTVDDNTKKLLNKVSNQIVTQNAKINTNQYTKIVSTPTTFTIPATGVTNILPTNWNAVVYSNPTQPPHTDPIAPSSKIDMDNPIYQNEFEEIKMVDIGDPLWDRVRGLTTPDNLGFYANPLPPWSPSIGLIDEVSEKEDDLYAKFPDGEIIPFKGHQEKIYVEFSTWNDLQRSDLIGDEIKKAATCRIFIDDRLARIIEGTDVQDLLMKADRAIDELKVQPFSICRDADTLVGKEIYYDNQPAIIVSIDELNNLICITPDIKFLNQFRPPVHAIEEEESEEWITKFGSSMLIRDYDEKIWWWRNTKGGNADLTKDPFYGQFPQPIPVPPQLVPNNQFIPGYTKYTTQPNTININPYTVLLNQYPTQWTITDSTTITWDTNGKVTQTYKDPLLNPPSPQTTPRDLDAQIGDAISYSLEDSKDKFKGPVIDKVIFDEVPNIEILPSV